MPKPLRFLADESCDYAIVRALRAAGYDVLAISEVMIRSRDPDLIAQSAQEERILLTEDKDFGWLVFVSHAASAGVILIRYPGSPRSSLGNTVVQLVKDKGEALRGCFVVIQPGHIRISPKKISTPQ